MNNTNRLLLAHAVERAGMTPIQKILTTTVFLMGIVTAGSWVFSIAIAQENSSNSNDTSKIVEADSTPPGAEIDQPKSEPDMIDEVTVMGSRSLRSLRREMVEAEDNIYAIFNSLNHDDGYDIICKKERRIGSQILYRVCKARLYREKVAEAAEDYLDQNEHYGVTLNAQQHNEILREKMRALAAENPQLVEALRKRLALQKDYELERDQSIQ
ncbi:MAG: hypothetical protein QNK34_05135 [Woeseiaceae bacterium]|nr:hypothetical protein [Woeseiaceae bacterium]